MGNEARKVELALAVLDKCARSFPDPPERGPALRLALRVLLPYASKHDLSAFWRITENDNPLQRMKHLKSVYGCIEAVARRSLTGLRPQG